MVYRLIYLRTCLAYDRSLNNFHASSNCRETVDLTCLCYNYVKVKVSFKGIFDVLVDHVYLPVVRFR